MMQWHPEVSATSLDVEPGSLQIPPIDMASQFHVLLRQLGEVHDSEVASLRSHAKNSTEGASVRVPTHHPQAPSCLRSPRASTRSEVVGLLKVDGNDVPPPLPPPPEMPVAEPVPPLPGSMCTGILDANRQSLQQMLCAI